jgi:hypothetical protein
MDLVHDRSLEFLYTVPAPASDTLGRDLRKPALHEIQPRAMRGCEVHDKPSGSCFQEFTHPFGVMTGCVVDDQVQDLLLTPVRTLGIVTK